MADSTEHREGPPVPDSFRSTVYKARRAFTSIYPFLSTCVYQPNQTYICTMDGCKNNDIMTLDSLRRHYQGPMHKERLKELQANKRAMRYVELDVNGWFLVNNYGYHKSKISLNVLGTIVSWQAANIVTREIQESYRRHGTHGARGHGHANPGIQGVDRGVHGPLAAQPQTAYGHATHQNRSNYPVATIPAIQHVRGLKTIGQGSSVPPYVSPYQDSLVGSTTPTGHAGSSVLAAPYLPVRGNPAMHHTRKWSRHTHQSNFPYVSPYADPVVASTGHAGSSIQAAPHLSVRAISPVEHLRKWRRHTHRSSSPYVSPYAKPVVESTTASTGHTDSTSHTAAGSHGAAGREHQGQEIAADRDRENQTGSEKGANPHGGPWM